MEEREGCLSLLFYCVMRIILQYVAEKKVDPIIFLAGDA